MALLRCSYLAACSVAVLVLTACRVDVTQTIDLTTQGRAVVSYAETFDDEAFSATGRLGGASAFGFDAAKADGWDVRRSSGPNQHTFVFQRSFSGENLDYELTRLAHDSAVATPNDAFPLGPTAFIGIPITIAATGKASASIPPLLRPSETVPNKGRKDPTFQLANARVNAAVVNSIVHIRIELKDETGIHRVEPNFSSSTLLTRSSSGGLRIGEAWPLSPLLAFWRNVGPYGVFDYQHNSAPLCTSDPKYHKAWIFGIGVYADGANMPEELMGSAVTLAESWLSQHPVQCPS